MARSFGYLEMSTYNIVRDFLNFVLNEKKQQINIRRVYKQSRFSHSDGIMARSFDSLEMSTYNIVRDFLKLVLNEKISQPCHPVSIKMYKIMENAEEYHLELQNSHLHPKRFTSSKDIIGYFWSLYVILRKDPTRYPIICNYVLQNLTLFNQIGMLFELYYDRLIDGNFTRKLCDFV